MHKWTLDYSQSSRKDFECVLKINPTLYKFIKTIPFINTIIYIYLQHGNNQSHAIHIDQFFSYQYT